MIRGQNGPGLAAELFGEEEVALGFFEAAGLAEGEGERLMEIGAARGDCDGFAQMGNGGVQFALAGDLPKNLLSQLFLPPGWNPVGNAFGDRTGEVFLGVGSGGPVRVYVMDAARDDLLSLAMRTL